MKIHINSKSLILIPENEPERCYINELAGDCKRTGNSFDINNQKELKIYMVEKSKPFGA